MRQRTSLTPEEYDPTMEESVGIPTTIEVPADAVSVDESPPQIPLKIEVMKVRKPSSRRSSTHHRRSTSQHNRRTDETEEADDDDIQSKAGSISGDTITRRSMQYDDYLYGSRNSPPPRLVDCSWNKKQQHQEEEEDKEQDISQEFTQASNTNSVVKEGAALAAIGSYLVTGARQASDSQRALHVDCTEDGEDTPHPVTPSPPSSRRGRAQPTTTSTGRQSRRRSQSVPSGCMQHINARETVDSFHDKSMRLVARSTSYKPREIGIDFSSCSQHDRNGQPSPPPPQRAVAHAPSTRSSRGAGARAPPSRNPSHQSVLAAQSSLSMIFAPKAASSTTAGAGAGGSVTTSSAHNKKQLSNRTMQTSSTHTTRSSSQHHPPPQHSSIIMHNSHHQDHSHSHNSSSGSNGNMINDVSELGASYSSHQDHHSTFVGYVMDESYIAKRQQQQEERRTSTDTPPRRPKVDSPPSKPSRSSHHQHQRNSSITTATTNTTTSAHNPYDSIMDPDEAEPYWSSTTSREFYIQQQQYQPPRRSLSHHYHQRLHHDYHHQRHRHQQQQQQQQHGADNNSNNSNSNSNTTKSKKKRWKNLFPRKSMTSLRR